MLEKVASRLLEELAHEFSSAEPEYKMFLLGTAISSCWIQLIQDGPNSRFSDSPYLGLKQMSGEDKPRISAYWCAEPQVSPTNEAITTDLEGYFIEAINNMVSLTSSQSSALSSGLAKYLLCPLRDSEGEALLPGRFTTLVKQEPGEVWYYYDLHQSEASSKEFARKVDSLRTTDRLRLVRK